MNVFETLYKRDGQAEHKMYGDRLWLTSCCGLSIVGADNHPVPLPQDINRFKLNQGITIIPRNKIPPGVNIRADEYSFIAEDGEEICVFMRNVAGSDIE